MKKLVVIILAFAVLTSIGVVQGGENITLRFSWWGGAERHEATLNAIKAFEAANPGIKVKAEYMGWDGYLERLTTQIGGGSEADVMQIDWAWIAMFSKDGNGFYDINKLKNDINLDEFDQQWLDSGSSHGKLNALPISFTALVMVWNKTMWEKVGLPFPKTWDEFFASGKVFHEKLGPNHYPIDMNWLEFVYLTHAYIFQKTGKQYLWPDKPEVALTREELIDWLNCYKSMVDSGTMMGLKQRIALGGDSERFSHEFREFVEGEWAGSMTFDSSLSVRTSTVKPEFQMAIGDFLMVPDAKSTGRVGRPSMLLAISKNSKNTVAAGKLIEFLIASEEGAKILKSTRGVFLSKSGYATLLKEGIINPLNKEAMDQVRATQCYTPNPFFEHARTKEVMRKAFEGYGYGNLTVEAAADILLDEGNKTVKRLAR